MTFTKSCMRSSMQDSGGGSKPQCHTLTTLPKNQFFSLLSPAIYLLSLSTYLAGVIIVPLLTVSITEIATISL